MLTFPYARKGSQHFPVVDISLTVPARPLTVKALVDSGASISVFRAEVLEYLNIPLTRGERVYLEGVGGRILGYRHRIPARVGFTLLMLPIVFSKELTVSFNLLGRDGFFERFMVIFDERRRITRLQAY